MYIYINSSQHINKVERTPLRCWRLKKVFPLHQSIHLQSELYKQMFFYIILIVIYLETRISQEFSLQ